MKNARSFGWVLSLILTAAASAQQTAIDPQVRTKQTADHKITTIELTAHFVTTIRVPEPVNSVVVGDPALFQVEHSEHEPELVFVKALTTEDAESNLLISTAKGRQISFLLVSHGHSASPAKVDRLRRIHGTRKRSFAEFGAVPLLQDIDVPAMVCRAASVVRAGEGRRC